MPSMTNTIDENRSAHKKMENITKKNLNTVNRNQELNMGYTLILPLVWSCLANNSISYTLDFDDFHLQIEKKKKII